MFTLVVFCPVLYSLDPQLMGIAVGAAVGGLCVSMLVGWPLVGLEVKNQVVEAEQLPFEKLLVKERAQARARHSGPQLRSGLRHPP